MLNYCNMCPIYKWYLAALISKVYREKYMQIMYNSLNIHFKYIAIEAFKLKRIC